MSGINFDVIAERQQFVHDRIHQLLGRSAGQICSANRTRKEHVADKNLSFGWFKQNDVAGRVAGTMDHLKLEFADLIFWPSSQ